jgi:hypothetical protein
VARQTRLTPEDLLLRTWDLVHHAKNFPTVQAPLITALQEIAKALRPVAAEPEDAPELVVEDGLVELLPA